MQYRKDRQDTDLRKSLSKLSRQISQKFCLDVYNFYLLFMFKGIIID